MVAQQTRPKLALLPRGCYNFWLMAERIKVTALPAVAPKGGGVELRFEDAKAFVCLANKDLVPGVTIVELKMQVPEVRFPFDISQGAAQFQRRLCDLAHFEVVIEA